MCLIIGVLVIAQGLILKGQEKLGSRFFIPKCLIPNYHEYYIEATEGECPICLGLLVEEAGMGVGAVGDEEGSAITEERITTIEGMTIINKEPIQRKVKRKIMRTPCNHTFHI